MHICSEPVLFRTEGTPPTHAPLGGFRNQLPTNWTSSPCGTLALTCVCVCVVSVLIYIKWTHLWACIHSEDECVCAYRLVSICVGVCTVRMCVSVHCTVHVPAVQCCLQEECVKGISSFSWLPGALLQICSRCVCVFFILKKILFLNKQMQQSHAPS